MTPQYTITMEQDCARINFQIGNRHIGVAVYKDSLSHISIRIEIGTGRWVVVAGIASFNPFVLEMQNVYAENYTRARGWDVGCWFMKWAKDPRADWKGQTNAAALRDMIVAALFEIQKATMQEALHQIAQKQREISKLTGVTHLSTAHAFVCDVTSFPPPFGVPDEHLVRRMNSTHKIGILNLRTNCLFDVAEDEDDALAVFSSNPHIHGSFALIDLTHPAYPALRVVSC